MNWGNNEHKPKKKQDIDITWEPRTLWREAAHVPPWNSKVRSVDAPKVRRKETVGAEKKRSMQCPGEPASIGEDLHGLRTRVTTESRSRPFWANSTGLRRWLGAPGQAIRVYEREEKRGVIGWTMVQNCNVDLQLRWNLFSFYNYHFFHNLSIFLNKIMSLIIKLHNYIK